MSTNLPFRVLMVEDSPDHAELIRICLNKAGPTMDIHHVDDGAKALDYLFNRDGFKDADAHPRPHLLLLDLNLPKVTGLSVLAQAKEDPRTADIPIVVLSSSDADSDVLAAYDRQANSYLVKPLTYRELKAQLATLVDYWANYNLGLSG